MNKSVLMRVVTLAAGALILVGVSLMTWMLVTDEERNNIKVNLTDGDTEVLEFEVVSLVPGEECEYDIQLKGDNAKQYDLGLDFVDTDEDKTLKNFARVKILANGELIRDELLADIFESEDIVLPVDFNEGKNTELKIVYYLPLDVGNEAKNAEAVFELRLKATNE